MSRRHPLLAYFVGALGFSWAIDTFSAPDPVVIRASTEATLLASGAIGLAMTVLRLTA